MATKERLEQVATVLTTTEHSPSEDLRALGLRLLAKELDDLAVQTHRQELWEMRKLAELHLNPPQCHITQICEEPVKRVRKIMERE